MNKTLLASVVVLFSINTAQAAMDHSQHKGAGKHKMDMGGMCQKPVLSNFSTANLAEVAPNSEVSFRVANIENPDLVTVTIKNIAVELNSEYKEPYYEMKVKLPESLHNTVARINIKVNGKMSHCEAEGGWLVKILE